MVMVFFLSLFLAAAVGYVWLGIIMIREVSLTWKDRVLGYFIGGGAVSFGLYMMYGVACQVRYYING